MLLSLYGERRVLDVQQDFSRVYPFLKIEFFGKKLNGQQVNVHPKKLLPSLTLKHAGSPGYRDGELPISDAMTVGELEEQLQNQFGLYVQVFRKSGNLWLETTMTDSWTLKQQNDHGEEIAIAFRPKSDDIDYDLNRDAAR